MYRRKIDETMLKWKSSPNHKPLVIKGCRQCGKTSSALNFAHNHYRHVIYLDFHEHREFGLFFAGSLDVDTILLNISAGIPEAVFIPGETCIVLDEIQECPDARSSLKFFHRDGRFDVIATGSLLGVSGYKSRDAREEEQRAAIPVGSEQIITMHPMDFEEWLWSNGITDQHINYLRSCLTDEKPVNAAIDSRMRQLLLQYIVVGGMPEAVSTFHQTNNLNDVLSIQRGIIENYKADMLKYATQADKGRIRECFESIPMQLAKENKKFQYSVIQKGARASQYLGCLRWIEDAGIIHRCYNTSITELPLSGNAIQDSFKVYMADIGLLISMLEQGTAWSILRGDLHGYKGAIYENLAADILTKMDRQLFFFQKDSGMELDFLIRYRGECCPIECKATTGNSKSLRTLFKHHEHYHVDHAIKVGDYNVGRAGQLLTLPFYMLFLLTET